MRVKGRVMSVSAALTALLAGVGWSAAPARTEGATKPTARRSDEDEQSDVPLLVLPPDTSHAYLAHQSHRSHSSHASHSSHYSGSGGGGSYGGGGGYVDDTTPVAPPPPPPPKPAVVSFAAFPGGKIYVDNQLMGRDSTGTLTLKPGVHEIRIQNRFLGVETRNVTLSAGQTGVVEIEW